MASIHFLSTYSICANEIKLSVIKKKRVTNVSTRYPIVIVSHKNIYIFIWKKDVEKKITIFIIQQNNESRQINFGLIFTFYDQVNEFSFIKK